MINLCKQFDCFLPVRGYVQDNDGDDRHSKERGIIIAQRDIILDDSIQEKTIYCVWEGERTGQGPRWLPENTLH